MSCEQLTYLAKDHTGKGVPVILSVTGHAQKMYWLATGRLASTNLVTRHEEHRKAVNIAAMRIEVFGDHRRAVLFDGFIVEVFGFREGGSRCHVAHLDELKIKTTRRGVRRLEGVMDSSVAFIVELTEETLPLAEQLIAEINRVRADSYGLGPVKD